MLFHFVLSLLLWSQAAAEKDPAKVGQKHGCTSDGRYFVHQDKGKKVYCWEGAGYGEDSAPPFVKSYFDESSSGSPQAGSPDVPFSPVGSVPKSSSGGGTGGGTGGGGNAAPKTTTFGPVSGGGGSIDPKAGSAGGGKIKETLRDLARDPAHASASLSAAARREPDPVSAQVLSSIENGMDRAAVLAKLGEPHGKILNTGDEGSLEIWTYAIRGGGYGSVRLDGGKVVKVVRPR